MNEAVEGVLVAAEDRQTGADKDLKTAKRTASQAQRILAWMEAGNFVDDDMARAQFGCRRLAARIKEIRDGKVDGKPRSVVTDTNAYGCATYYLEK